MPGLRQNRAPFRINKQNTVWVEFPELRLLLAALLYFKKTKLSRNYTMTRQNV